MTDDHVVCRKKNAQITCFFQQVPTFSPVSAHTHTCTLCPLCVFWHVRNAPKQSEHPHCHDSTLGRCLRDRDETHSIFKKHQIRPRCYNKQMLFVLFYRRVLWILREAELCICNDPALWARYLSVTVIQSSQAFWVNCTVVVMTQLMQAHFDQ